MQRLIPILAILMIPAMAGGAAQAAETAGMPAGTSVEMPYLMAPLNDGDQLVAYAYISSRVVAASDTATIDVRNRLPFIQDAYVRDVNRLTIAKPGEPRTVDTAGLIARFLADARKVVGADRVRAITITSIQVAPLKPTGQTMPNKPS